MPPTSVSPTITPAAIQVRGLCRSFRRRKGWLRAGAPVEAVRGISFDVSRGAIFGVLGPNGAGKTTTIKILATLLLPSRGTAIVNGFDVVRDEQQVRAQLGVLFGGDKGLYNQLSARENLRYFGRLYGMDDTTIRRRSEALLERVQLQDRATERVESYSRGMKQRLHIAKTLIHDPDVVILDEPTIGLDPAAAIGVRELISDLVPEHTVLLTTHDMHEADTLCREIAIIDQGRIVASGTPTALKAGTAIERRVVLTIAADPGERVASIARSLTHRSILTATPRLDSAGLPQLDLVCTDTTLALDVALARIREGGMHVQAIAMREPTLEDAFLHATGREFEPLATSIEEGRV